MRKSLLWLSEQQKISNFVRRNSLARKFASRFIAGETVDTAVDAALELNKRKISATLDLLGECVTKESEAAEARDIYLRMLDHIAETRADSNVSLKLTQMGFDIGEDLCFANVSMILDKARQLNTFVRIDMESSDYTQRTLDFFAHRLYGKYAAVTGVVIQSCLRRSEEDVERLIGMRARVRLCKGAYLEPPSVAFPDKADVDRNYVRLMERLMERGNYAGLATHDERIIARAREFAKAKAISPERFEFQMLYGVRRDFQENLHRQGHHVRVYIPFGSQWYPYLMRRLAERPANIAFILGNVVKEAVPGL